MTRRAAMSDAALRCASSTVCPSTPGAPWLRITLRAPAPNWPPTLCRDGAPGVRICAHCCRGEGRPAPDPFRAPQHRGDCRRGAALAIILVSDDRVNGGLTGLRAGRSGWFLSRGWFLCRRLVLLDGRDSFPGPVVDPNGPIVTQSVQAGDVSLFCRTNLNDLHVMLLH